ncbi:MAG: MBL fold metallo-hydrolase [Clostridia bacterium]|nr:MBL fold metallo-hydrolase [Clostridia bacterium]
MNKRKNKGNTIKTAKETRSIYVSLVIFLFITILFSCTFFFKDKLENFVNFAYNENALSTVIDENGLIIHFIDVGQADATLIEFPNDEIMLIDCGDTSATSQQKFRSYLNKIDFEIENEEKVIDYLVLTHPDSDHIGGAEYIFDNYKVKTCYRPDIYASNEEIPADTSLIVQLLTGDTAELYANVIIKIIEEGCLSIKTVQELEISSTNYVEETSQTDPLDWIVNFYAPIVSELPYRTNDNYLEPKTNDYSPIMILSYLDKKIMFTGDASEDVERDFIDYYSDEEIDFDIDILKVGHHGSRYSTCEELLNFVYPEYAIISVGADNNYGHPSAYTLDRLSTYGLNNNEIYRTDINGNIIMGVSPNGELTLKASYTQYSTQKIEWWTIFLVLEGLTLIIIFTPYLIKIKLNKNN